MEVAVAGGFSGHSRIAWRDWGGTLVRTRPRGAFAGDSNRRRRMDHGHSVPDHPARCRRSAGVARPEQGTQDTTDRARRVLDNPPAVVMAGRTGEYFERTVAAVTPPCQEAIRGGDSFG